MPAFADDVSVAVAANFTEAAEEIATAFNAATGHTARLSFGASGQFYTQITQAAPFEVFLSADDERPALAVEEGFGVEGSVFTYAIGQLVLYSTDAALVTGEETLTAGEFQKLSVADPETAPYGVAAIETMTALGVIEVLRPKFVTGTNISQAYQFVQSNSAEIGFVALSQISQVEGGSRWIVPAELHEPIRQDAVLLKTGEDNPAATAFVNFLKGDQAHAIIEKYGYALNQ
ncbi:MAG: molybdate ABC transporter substrate-binding protein [Nitrococcus sp.]|nr:molybdate ABC transporter substrate-binding protein [Nitrococcus sp.]